MDNNPATPSLAYAKLEPAWRLIKDIRAGLPKVREQGCRDEYLPRLEDESPAHYDFRVETAPWRPEFEDALRGICSRPFAKEVRLVGEPTTDIKELAEDIDGRGNNLNVFARDVFDGGVALGLHGIYVDWSTTTPQKTRADEKAVGARPYWISLAADDIIALATERRGGREVVTHLRFRECVIEMDGYKEVVRERIREVVPGKWVIWQKRAGDLKVEWDLIGEGVSTLDEVSLALFVAGDRKGAQYVRPPLLDLAHMQIELFRALSNKHQAYWYAGAPMLSANGLAPSEEAVKVGPGRILWAPGGEGVQTSWSYVHPNAANLEILAKDVRSIIDDMRRLGMQPLLPGTGDVTATASGIEAAKAHSAVQAWAGELKDTLEQAWVYTAQWLKRAETVEVDVHTDFVVGVSGQVEIPELLKARQAGEISRQTYWDEMRRRGVLGPQFDPDEEEKRLDEETDDTDDEAEMAAALARARMVPEPPPEPPPGQQTPQPIEEE